MVTLPRSASAPLPGWPVWEPLVPIRGWPMATAVTGGARLPRAPGVVVAAVASPCVREAAKGSILSRPPHSWGERVSSGRPLAAEPGIGRGLPWAQVSSSPADTSNGSAWAPGSV